MTVLCLTGWQQPADALSSIAPDAVHFDYAAYDNVEAMFAHLPRAPKLAIGWSLGGQLLVRAVAGGHIAPGALILLGAPFQWVADTHFAYGVPVPVATAAQADYRRDEIAMLKNLNTLVALGDTHEKTIARALNADVRLWKNGGYWLSQLAGVSCRTFDFAQFPPTVIVHGKCDRVIHVVNAEAYNERLPQSRLLLWDGCAHAPQLHDAKAIREIVSAYV